MSKYNFNKSIIDIKQASNKEVIFKNGYYTTKDIISAICYADSLNKPYTVDFVNSIKGIDINDTCNNIWQFIKKNISYVEDREGVQEILSPGKLNDVGKGDCKSYSNFISSCLKNLNIKHVYRFISETGKDDLHHVYIVAFDENNNEVFIDAVLDQFNREVAYKKKKDYNFSNYKRIGSVVKTKVAISKGFIFSVVLLTGLYLYQK